MSDHICSNCNRLRLTSQGLLKLCLYSDICLDLREMLHNGADDNEIKNAVIAAIRYKPRQHTIGSESAGIKCMSNIGG
jgi:cyclic pyranopterin phosphate synthase